MNKSARKIYKTLSVSILLTSAFFFGRWVKIPSKESLLLSFSKENSKKEPLVAQQHGYEDAETSLLRAKMYKSQGDIQRAEKDFESAVMNYTSALSLNFTENKLRARLLLSLAETLSAQGKLQEALEQSAKGVSLAQEDMRVKGYLYRCMGSTQKKLGNIQGAIVSYKKGLELNHIYDRLSGMLHSDLADLLLETGSTDQAIYHYEQTLDKSEIDASLRAHTERNLNKAFIKRAFQLASDASSKLKEKDAEGALALYEKVLCLATIPQSLKDSAQQGISSALEIKLVKQIEKADLLMLTGQSENALHLYHDALSFKQQNPELTAQIHYKIGKAKHALKDLDGALSAYNTALTFSSSDQKALLEIQKAKNSILVEEGTALLRQGETALGHGRLEDAATLFKNGLALQASDHDLKSKLQSGLKTIAHKKAVILFTRAEKYQELGKIDEAISHYRDGIALGSSNSELLAKVELNLGDLLIQKSELSEALEIYNSALDLAIQDELLSAILHLKTGDLYQLTGQKELACKNYAEALALNPENTLIKSMLFCRLGKTLLMQNKLSGAINAFEQGLAIESISHQLRTEMEEALKDALKQKEMLLSQSGYYLYKQSKQAAEQLVRAPAPLAVAEPVQVEEQVEIAQVEQMPSDMIVQKEVAAAPQVEIESPLESAEQLVANGSFAEAIKLYEQCANAKDLSSNERAALYEKLGALSERIGNQAQAISYYQEGLNLAGLDEKWVEVLSFNLASLYVKQEQGLEIAAAPQKAEAKESVKESATEKKTEKNNWKAAVKSYVAAGEHDKAAALYIEAIKAETNPKRKAMMEYNLGNILLEGKNLEGAIECYKKSIRYPFKDESIKAFAWNNMGHAFNLLGKKAEANNCFKEGIKCCSAKHTAKLSLHYNLANNLFEAGQMNEAISDYQQALAANQNESPLIASIHQKLGTALMSVGKTGEAMENYHAALSLGLNDKGMETDLLNQLVTLHQTKGQLEQAASCAKRALELGVADTATKLQLCKFLGLFLFKNGDAKSSAHYYNESRQLQQELNQITNN